MALSIFGKTPRRRQVMDICCVFAMFSQSTSTTSINISRDIFMCWLRSISVFNCGVLKHDCGSFYTICPKFINILRWLRWIYWLHMGTETYTFFSFLEDTSSFCGVTGTHSCFWTSGDICPGILKVRVDPLYVLSPAQSRFLRFTFGEKPGNCLMAIIAAQPFWSTYFFKQWRNSNRSTYYSVWQTGAPTVWITPAGLLSQKELFHRPSTQRICSLHILRSVA